MKSDRNVRAVIDLLRELAAKEMLEPGREESLRRCLRDLCRARRTHDSSKLWAAVDRAARIFLRASKH